MLFEKLQRDERTISEAGKLGSVWLGITQIMLAGVVFYRLYVLNQPDEQLTDFRTVLAISIFGHIFMQLMFGGLLPMPTKKGMLVLYLILAGTISGVCLAIYGMPAASEWQNTWLPALLGPALLVGAYSFVAWLGKRRIEKMIEG